MRGKCGPASRPHLTFAFITDRAYLSQPAERSSELRDSPRIARHLMGVGDRHCLHLAVNRQVFGMGVWIVPLRDSHTAPRATAAISSAIHARQSEWTAVNPPPGTLLTDAQASPSDPPIAGKSIFGGRETAAQKTQPATGPPISRPLAALFQLSLRLASIPKLPLETRQRRFSLRLAEVARSAFRFLSFFHPRSQV